MDRTAKRATLRLMPAVDDALPLAPVEDGRFFDQHWPDHVDMPLAGREDGAAREIERRIFRVIASERPEIMFR